MYTLKLLRELAYKLAKELPELYRPNNEKGCLSNVPFNWYLHDDEPLKKYILRLVKEQNPKSEIYIIRDLDAHKDPMGYYYELKDGNPCTNGSDLIKEGDNYIISINPHQEKHDERFTSIKELCSLYTNYHTTIIRKEQFQTFHDYEESLKSSHNQRKKIRGNRLEANNLKSDTFAILLATELMIPPRHRIYTDGLLERVQRKGMSMNDVAQSLCMPEYMLKKTIDLSYYPGSCQYYASQMVPPPSSQKVSEFI